MIEPSDFIKYVGSKNIPKNLIITYRGAVLRYFRRKYKPEPIKLHDGLVLYKHKNIGLIKLTGIGSPYAATVLEELIAMGARVFLNIGTAGGLYKDGTVFSILLVMNH